MCVGGSLLKLPAIEVLIKTHNLTASKKLGQNYVIQQSVTDNMVRVLGDLSDKIVVEVGPGVGTLTRSLLALSAAPKIIAVEKDRQFKGVLDELRICSGGRLDVLFEDALCFHPIMDSRVLDAASVRGVPVRDVVVIANLPYNIGTRLLMQWLDAIYCCIEGRNGIEASQYDAHSDSSKDVHPRLSEIVIMLQLDVVDRIVATPKSKNYGLLSVFSQWLCSVSKLFVVAPEAFIPSPGVMSAVVRLTPVYDRVLCCTQKQLLDICKRSFGARRKMLRRSLKGIMSANLVLASYVEKFPNIRPEELSVDDFVKIAEAHTMYNYVS